MKLRPYRAEDESAVRRIFWQTVALGNPLPQEIPHADRYEALCLDWYLRHGSEDIGIVDGGPATVDPSVHVAERIAGYVLVCTDERAFRKWRRREVAAFLGAVMPGLMSHSYPPFADRFYRLRIRDGLAAAAQPAVPPAHVHFNIVSGRRNALLMRELVAHADGVCRDQERGRWYGEMNAVEGTRARVLEAYGGEIVNRQRNFTLSWLIGAPVERLTVVRRVGDPLVRENRPQKDRPGGDPVEPQVAD